MKNLEDFVIFDVIKTYDTFGTARECELDVEKKLIDIIVESEIDYHKFLGLKRRT